MTTPPASIDLKRLAAEVSAQHGIRIDQDDPMMAVVTLNRLVFEQAVAQVLDRVQSAVRDFEAATEKVQVRAGGVLAQEVRDCAMTLREEFVKAAGQSGSYVRDAQALNCHVAAPSKLAWLFAGLALASVLVGIGVWFGARLH
jgi:CHASE3 domain sensor protein